MSVLYATLLLGAALWAPHDAEGAGGRFTYREKVYPSAAAACAQLLKDLSPPETLKEAGAPDEFGNVHYLRGRST